MIVNHHLHTLLAQVAAIVWLNSHPNLQWFFIHISIFNDFHQQTENTVEYWIKYLQKMAHSIRPPKDTEQG